MKFESKFNIGDKVYSVNMSKEKIFYKCNACDGSGKLIGKDGMKYDCSACYGRGGDYKYGDTKWFVERQLTIGKIEISYTDSKGIDGMIGCNYKTQKKYEEEYMCEETGIGSGRNYKAEDLFCSEDEAKLYCDRRNNEKMPECQS